VALFIKIAYTTYFILLCVLLKRQLITPIVVQYK
jgi:hypothetical protein